MLTMKMYGHRLQMQINEETAMLLKVVLSTLNKHPDLCHCCISKPAPLSLAALFRSIVRIGVLHTCYCMGWVSHANHSSSSAAKTYTPGNTSCSGVVKPQPTLQMRGRKSGAQLSPQPTVPQGSACGPANPVGHHPYHHVLFAVKGFRWSWELEPIPMTSVMCDSTFFRTLRSHHRGHRRAFLHWISPYRFKNCRSVKARHKP